MMRNNRATLVCFAVSVSFHSFLVNHSPYSKFEKLFSAYHFLRHLKHWARIQRLAVLQVTKQVFLEKQKQKNGNIREKKT